MINVNEFLKIFLQQQQIPLEKYVQNELPFSVMFFSWKVSFLCDIVFFVCTIYLGLRQTCLSVAKNDYVKIQFTLH